MKANEKAKELFLKFRQIPPSSPYTGIDDGEAKDCALIAVDEILDVLYSDEIYNPGNIAFDRIDDYWQKVKEEIINMQIDGRTTISD